MTPPRPVGSTSALERLYVPDRAAWRRWLAEHHATSPGVWLIFDKKRSRPERLAYGDSVEEALCFGWVDSTVNALDDARYMQRFAPRKPASAWSRSNKDRVARLTEQGLMMPAGVAAVEAGKRLGGWTSGDAVEALEVPPDLAAALAAHPTAARNFAAFAPSARKGYLHWVTQAKRSETRSRRVAETVALAAENRKSHLS
ncbi:MAG: YdeI/OmpD-associated family protein [Gemmatimonadaceae bacterium]